MALAAAAAAGYLLVLLSLAGRADVAAALTSTQGAAEAAHREHGAASPAAEAGWRAALESGSRAGDRAAVAKAQRRLGIALSLSGLRLAGGVGRSQGELASAARARLLEGLSLVETAMSATAASSSAGVAVDETVISLTSPLHPY